MRTFSLVALLAVAASAQITTGPVSSVSTSTAGGPLSSGLSAGAPGDVFGPGDTLSVTSSTSTSAQVGGGVSSATAPTPVSGSHSGSTQTIPPKNTGLPPNNNNSTGTGDDDEDPAPEETSAAVSLRSSTAFAVVVAGVASVVF